MARLISPLGSLVEVADEKVDRLLVSGYTKAEDDSKTAARKPAAKKTAARKSGDE